MIVGLGILLWPAFFEVLRVVAALPLGVAGYLVWHSGEIAARVRMSEEGVEARMYTGRLRSIPWRDIEALRYSPKGHAGQYGIWPEKVIVVPRHGRSIILDGYLSAFEDLIRTLKGNKPESVRWENRPAP